MARCDFCQKPTVAIDLYDGEEFDQLGGTFPRLCQKCYTKFQRMQELHEVQFKMELEDLRRKFKDRFVGQVFKTWFNERRKRKDGNV